VTGWLLWVKPQTEDKGKLVSNTPCRSNRNE
jgi:hypothetical protein